MTVTHLLNLMWFKSLHTWIFGPSNFWKCVRLHSSNSYKNATAVIVNPVVKMPPHLAAHVHYPTTRKYHPSPRIYQTEKRTALDMPENPAVFIHKSR